MSPIEHTQREALCAIARSWIGTPYRHRGRVRGRAGGVDCVMLLAECFAQSGLLPRIEIPPYPQDWHLHRGAERYLSGLLSYAREIDSPPQPGDVALWRFGRCFSHAALVTGWPQIIHSYVSQGCVAEDVTTAPWLMFAGPKPRAMRLFSIWPAKNAAPMHESNSNA